MSDFCKLIGEKEINGTLFSVYRIRGVLKYMIDGKSVRHDVYLSALTDAVA